MLRLRRLSLLLLLAASACGNGGEPDTYDATRPTRSRAERVQEPRPAGDTRPPLFGGFVGDEALAWGQFRLTWQPAVDNTSPGPRIVYQLEGLAPGPAGYAPIELTSDPGAADALVDADPAYTVWRVRAQDEAGNLSDPLEPRLVRTAPRLVQVGTDAVQGDLQRCARETSGRLVCGGENGRFAVWVDGRWIERSLPASVEVEPVVNPDGAIELATAAGRYTLDASGEAVADPQQFEWPPSYPLRRFLYEPSGLAQWVDAEGRIWASNGGPFRVVGDPFLLGPRGGCEAVRDLLYAGQRGFARCASGAQLLLRADEAGYRWGPLADTQALPQDVGTRSVLFGEGRQISLLGTDDRVWRYDLGGWRAFYPTEVGQPPAGAIAPAEEARLIRIAAGNQISRMDSLGGGQPVPSPPVLAPIVYLEPADRGGLAVTAWGEVVDVPGNAVLRGAPPTGFVQVIREGDDVAALIAEQPELGLYLRYEQGFTHESLPALNTGDTLWHQVIRVGPGEFLLALDRGPEGGQIARLANNRLQPEMFLYPPPPEPPDEDEPLPVVPAEGTGTPDPRLLLVGVPADDLDAAPAPPMPVRAIAWDHATGTGVAAGEGGSLWLDIEGGWLRIDPPLVVPTPFTALRIVGDHQYLVGAVDGLLLTCDWATCAAGQLEIGDIREFRAVGQELWALGSNGVARRNLDGTWETLALVFGGRSPTASPPTALAGAVESGGVRWLLGDDGSIWRSADGAYEAMGLVEAPLDLWADIDGQVVVATRDALYRFGAD